MRILVASFPGVGHVTPMLPVVKELVKRGHEIWWYTGKAFQQKIERTGATYKGMQGAYDFSGMTKEESFPQLKEVQGVRVFIEVWKEVFINQGLEHYKELKRLLAEFPADLILADDLCFGAGLLHEKTGLPWVMLASTIYLYSSKDTAPFGLALPPDQSFVGQLRNAFLQWTTETFVLRSVKKHATKVRATLDLPPARGNAVMCLVPKPALYLLGTIPAFEYPRSDLYKPAHFVGPFFDVPQDVFTPPTWWADLQHGWPVVHVTQGTVETEASDLIIPTIKALAHEDVLVVATTGIPKEQVQAQIGALPENTRLETFVPHYQLLPHVSVMITNGGYNGVQMALANGVPLIMAGTTEEKPEVAMHVAYTGAGINLKTRTPSESAIRDAVHTILSHPTYEQHAQNLQKQYKNFNGSQTAADWIERLYTQANSLPEYQP